MYSSVFRFVMSERFKYANNGVYKCEDFTQHLAAGQFPRFPLGQGAYINRLFITFKVRGQYNQIYPCIFGTPRQKIKIRAFFNIKAKFWSLCYKTNESVYMESGLETAASLSGPSMNIRDVLNEENGYLENGALSVEYGFHVNAFEDYDGIWNFEFRKQMFDNNGGHKTVTCYSDQRKFCIVFHYPKQLLLFHSSSKESEEADLHFRYTSHYVETCLQIAHGVCIQSTQRNRIPANTWLRYAEIGRAMKLMNVVHYCDRMYVRNYPSIIDKNDLKKAIKLNMRQSAPHIMGLWKSKELMMELREYLDEMPGEMMKMVVAEIFERYT